MSERPPSRVVRNEQTKLLATGLNNLGIATIVAGTIAPLIARSYGASSATGDALPILIGLIYLFAGTFLMFLARAALKELIDDIKRLPPVANPTSRIRDRRCTGRVLAAPSPLG